MCIHVDTIEKIRCLTQTGAGNMDEVALSRMIGSRTGGIYPSVFSGGVIPPNDTIATGDDLVYKLFLHGKAVHSKSEDLFELLFEVLSSAKLDNKKRIVEVYTLATFYLYFL
jgi:hypothetical protein